LAIPFNTGLDPETGNNFEVGIKRSGSRWSGGLTLYYMLMDDEIFFDESARLNRNLGESKRLGLELDTSWQVENFGYYARIAWVDAEFRGNGSPQAGERIPLVPELNTSLSVWLLVALDWRVAVDLRYQSDQIQGNDFLNTARIVPAHFLCGLSLQWNFIDEFNLTLRVNNLFDRDYISTAYSGGFYPGSGREFRVGLKGSF
jgi:iron complex outermembrane receptor protein